jgi:hypothetical protein
MDFRNVRTRIAAASLLVATAGAAFTALPATALIPAFASVTPTTVHAGETIDASGICGGTTVTMSLYTGWVDATTPPSGTPVATADGVLGVSDWTGSLVVPGDAAPGAYTFNGHCEGNSNNFDYANVEITVLPAVVTTTTTQAPTTSLPATSTTAANPATGPAIAVAASPTYTG